MPNRRYPRRSPELAASNQLHRASPGALHGQSFIPSPARGERQDVLSYSTGNAVGYAEDRFVILNSFSSTAARTSIVVGELTYLSNTQARRICYYQKSTGSVRLLEEWEEAYISGRQLVIYVNSTDPINGDYPRRMNEIHAGDIVICQYAYYEGSQ